MVGQQVEHRGVLQTQGQLADVDSIKADVGQTAERLAGGRRVAVLHVEAVFQAEEGTVTVAQVFRAAQAPAAVGDGAVFHRDAAAFLADAAGAGVQVADADVGDTVQGDAGFSRSRAGGQAKACEGEG
ncbi:hypothetical protein G6F57_017865 [Rhizopus arrhizus]|nr:hypothetical protein G6F57_017865 [Rhizopus arrhizus]